MAEKHRFKMANNQPPSDFLEYLCDYLSLIVQMRCQIEGLVKTHQMTISKNCLRIPHFQNGRKNRFKMADNQPSSDFLEYLIDYLFPMVQIRCQIEGLGKTHQMTILKNCLQPPNFQNGRKTCEKSTFSCFF
jgi:hypothetical protein